MVIGGIGPVLRRSADRSRNGGATGDREWSQQRSDLHKPEYLPGNREVPREEHPSEMQARNRTQAVVIALRAALVSLPD